MDLHNMSYGTANVQPSKTQIGLHIYAVRSVSLNGTLWEASSGVKIRLAIDSLHTE